MTQEGSSQLADDDTTTTTTAADDDATKPEDGDGEPQGAPADTDPATQPAAPMPAPRPAPPADAWKPPSREEWEKVTAGLRDASGESAARKKKLRELEAQLEEMKAANATAEERAALELEKRVLGEAEARWRPRVVAAEAKSALLAAGCKDPGRFARLIDLGKVEVGEDGTTGLDDQVAALKKDYPEAFKKERPATEPQAAQPGSTRVPDKKLTATQRQAAALLGNR